MMRVERGTKDHLTALCDLRDLKMRTGLHPRGNPIPLATYTRNDGWIYALLEWIKSLRFPNGYIFDLARNINMRKHNFWMKSHDGHIFMQRLILVSSFQELLLLPIWEALNELSLFFKIYFP